MKKTVMKKCQRVFLMMLVAALPLLLAGCGGNGSMPLYNISGSISGQTVNFSFIWIEDPSGVQNTYTFNGAEGSNGTLMSGTWTNGGGAEGTWSGVFVVHQ